MILSAVGTSFLGSLNMIVVWDWAIAREHSSRAFSLSYPLFAGTGDAGRGSDGGGSGVDAGPEPSPAASLLASAVTALVALRLPDPAASGDDLSARKNHLLRQM